MKQDKWINLLCAALFCAFTFIYLFFYQADVLAYGQWRLSYGVTHYNNVVGTIVIVVTLYLMRVLMCRTGRNAESVPALTYLPSMLFLALITDIDEHIVEQFSFIKYGLLLLVYVGAFLLLAWLINSWFGEGLKRSSQLVRANVNALIMLALFILVGCVGNSDGMFHQRLRIGRYIAEGEFDKASRVGEKANEADSMVTALHAYSMARAGIIGEEFFERPNCGSSANIIPQWQLNMFINASEQGDTTAFSTNQITFIAPLTGKYQSLRRKDYYDYALTALLLDRKINTFARCLPRYYVKRDTTGEYRSRIDSVQLMPKHFREALLLYTRLRSNPSITYSNVTMDADFNDFAVILRQTNDLKERRKRLRQSYVNTYWYYYFLK